MMQEKVCQVNNPQEIFYFYVQNSAGFLPQIHPFSENAFQYKGVLKVPNFFRVVRTVNTMELGLSLIPPHI